MELLFSYGTLQQDNVQLQTFGRLLVGRPDRLPRYAQTFIEILDPAVVATSGKSHHPIVACTGQDEDAVEGMVFEVTPAELDRADRYEVSDYRRARVQLASGVSAWVYLDARSGA